MENSIAIWDFCLTKQICILLNLEKIQFYIIWHIVI